MAKLLDGGFAMSLIPNSRSNADDWLKQTNLI
jgi:hypothetical protein